MKRQPHRLYFCPIRGILVNANSCVGVSIREQNPACSEVGQTPQRARQTD